MNKKLRNSSVLTVIALVGAIVVITILGIYIFIKQNPSKSNTPAGPARTQVVEGSDISIESKEYKIGIRDKKALLSALSYTFHVFDALPDSDRSIKIVITTKTLPATPENGKVQVTNQSQNGVYIVEMQIPRFLIERPAPNPSLNPLNLQSSILLNLPSKLSQKEVLDMVKKFSLSNTQFFTLDWK